MDLRDTLELVDAWDGKPGGLGIALFFARTAGGEWRAETHLGVAVDGTLSSDMTAQVEGRVVWGQKKPK